ncbi:glycosyl hydrolase family 28 protein [Edaphobacter dinghuensis]|uniref:glycosyl hydrolase family 28 protein n=1 Tax=Edaphobacter dinghuensis TaxID=1560005 RepID=UPI0016653A8C|nr:glycosyl hydrolase family 28 protein [Edaphobacter dinghuensis]
MAAGSFFGGAVTGCGASELYIPCLGPADAPVPVAGMTYIRASEIGCALDCNLENGRHKYTGGVATDDGPRINAAMAAASANHPITLIIDGSALISGLFLPAGGYWGIAGLGCGTGFFVKEGTNNDGIHNGLPNANVPSDPGPPAPARGMNVSLSNFTLNGNQGNGLNGDSTSKVRQGSANLWYFGINLMNLDNISLNNVVVVNTPAYQIRLSNVGHVTATGCVMRSFGVNTDGLHFDGPANDITISGCDFTTGDDAIAFNAPEGYSGNISRVAVTDCTFNSFSMMRLYTANGSPQLSVDTVSVSNCKGTFSEAVFNIGFQASGSYPNPVTGLTVSNCILTAPVVFAVTENFGSIQLNNVTYIPIKGDQPCAILAPSLFYRAKIHGLSLTLNNCVIYRLSGIEVAAVILGDGSAIDNLSFNGFALQDGGSYSPALALINVGLGSIGQLVLNSVNGENIEVPIVMDRFASVGSISGSGVLATGWKFADSMMANGVPYLSANSNQPSIKVEDVVEPYSAP